MAPLDIFVIPELLENILVNLPVCDLLFNAQRVSKEWKSIVKRSPRIQKTLFMKSSQTSQDENQYTKNKILGGILGNFFSLYFTSDEPDDFTMAHSQSSKIDLSEFDYQLRFHYRPIWLADNASWRSMFVSQPPITRVHWHMDIGWDPMFFDCEKGMPTMAAELHFPEGLRMGDYYDLIVATLGIRTVKWPSLRPPKQSRGQHPSVPPLPPLTVAQWNKERMGAAEKDGALLISQVVYRRDIFAPPGARDDWWPRTDLREKYHKRLVKLEKREPDPNALLRYKYTALDPQSTSSMDQFLQAVTTLAP
ncbi:hypothetical protein F4820DRAFT_449366 [Hypoxylon rubiginosum]|uniref:Uncharacterized protein n=1 Tax=Hypoxylon rubiginosum TaxID=110542 RepID=A0ACB9YXA9_9PEZI|nr:hypothetical protein F4820DRAFT_449366 [Hypoxylon rubiginosum]